ncbi:MAG: DisA protein [Desulfobacteraceae bacterium]|nr:MAG: DisA protein [Desulfobacteraceae bacterium]
MNQFLSALRWQDVLDIGLTSYVLFRLYVLFRGTYVFRVLISLISLWVAQQAAFSIGLIVTTWILRAVLALSAFIIIVVFRNEIRRAMQIQSLKTILWGISMKLKPSPLDHITNAVFHLAEEKIGALLVFPGREDIGELLQNGIAWNGKISVEMILSIFSPKSPVHDGAAVVEGDRISRVSAFLPLSRGDDLPSHFGTRHRAALGISEPTDAIAVVVSEERGEIMIAKGARLQKIAEPDILKKELEEHFSIDAPENRMLSKNRLEIVAAALVSVLFISAVWFSLSKGQESIVNLEVPVQYVNRKPGMEIVQTSNHRVNVELSGSAHLARSLQPEAVQIQVDLRDAKLGENNYRITSRNVFLPPGFALVNVYPYEVRTVLDVIIEKRLPVQVDWTGKMPGDRIVTDAVIEPDSVPVKGGKQMLESIETIYTEKVSTDRLEDEGVIQAGLALKPPSLQLLNDPEPKVTIRYKTRERTKLLAPPAFPRK